MPQTPFLLTTLCYIEKDDCFLMLHRTKKKHDISEGKWIGVGGKFEEGETPEECLLREVREETGLTLTDYRLRGIITFQNDAWPTEYMFLYTASGFSGTLAACAEGVLRWIPKSDLLSLSLWEGDKIFLKLLAEDAPFFSLRVSYHGDTLENSALTLYPPVNDNTPA